MSEDETEGEDGAFDGDGLSGLLLVGAMLLVVVLALISRSKSGGKPMEILGRRLAAGKLTKEELLTIRSELRLDAEPQQSSLDAAMEELYRRYAAGEISRDRLWEIREALGT